MSHFSRISKTYEKDSLVQKSASHILLDLLDIRNNDNVLDLGCGTGHVTKVIKEKTTGNVIGVDPAEGMVENATKKYAAKGISFYNLSVEKLEYRDLFDVIFCNSAFQWFTHPKPAIKRCHNALKYNGKIGIQAPAKEHYCPNFLEAIEAVKTNSQTKGTFAHFTSPWFFLNDAQDYKKLFEEAGFKVEKSTIVRVSTHHSAEEICRIFDSGAAAGYLNQTYYSDTLPADYSDAFKTIVRNVFLSQADKSGNVELIFYRIYLLAVKEKR